MSNLILKMLISIVVLINIIFMNVFNNTLIIIDIVSILIMTYKYLNNNYEEIFFKQISLVIVYVFSTILGNISYIIIIDIHHINKILLILIYQILMVTYLYFNQNNVILKKIKEKELSILSAMNYIFSKITTKKELYVALLIITILIGYLSYFSRIYVELIPVLVLFIAALRISVITLKTANNVSIKIQKRDVGGIIEMVKLLKEAIPKPKTAVGIAIVSTIGVGIIGASILYENKHDGTKDSIETYKYLIEDLNKDIRPLRQEIHEDKLKLSEKELKDNFLENDIKEKEVQLNKLQERKDFYIKKIEILNEKNI